VITISPCRLTGGYQNGHLLKWVICHLHFLINLIYWWGCSQLAVPRCHWTARCLTKAREIWIWEMALSFRGFETLPAHGISRHSFAGHSQTQAWFDYHLQMSRNPKWNRSDGDDLMSTYTVCLIGNGLGQGTTGTSGPRISSRASRRSSLSQNYPRAMLANINHLTISRNHHKRSRAWDRDTLLKSEKKALNQGDRLQCFIEKTTIVAVLAAASQRGSKQRRTNPSRPDSVWLTRQPVKWNQSVFWDRRGKSRFGSGIRLETLGRGVRSFLCRAISCTLGREDAFGDWELNWVGRNSLSMAICEWDHSLLS
jgi:hypothetical protein